MTLNIQYTKEITDGFHFRRKDKNGFGTKNSTFTEIANQRSGDTTYQELSVSELDKADQKSAAVIKIFSKI